MIRQPYLNGKIQTKCASSSLPCRFAEDPRLSDRSKSAVCEALAVNESRLLDGASEYLQLMDLATVIMTEARNAAKDEEEDMDQ